MGQNRLLPYRSNIGTRLSNDRVPLFTLSNRKDVEFEGKQMALRSRSLRRDQTGGNEFDLGPGRKW